MAQIKSKIAFKVFASGLLLEVSGKELELFLILIDGQLFGPCAKKKAKAIVKDLSKNSALREKISLIRLKTNKLGTAEEAEILC